MRNYQTTWTSSDQAQTLGVFLYILYALMALAAILAAKGDRAGEFVFVTFAIFGAYVTGVSSFSSYVSYEQSGVVVVRNPITTRRIPVGAVKSIDSKGLSFLTLRLANGGTVKCWAIQATNAMLGAGKETRVDKVADELRAAVGELKADQTEAHLTHTFTRPPIVFLVFLGLVLVGCAIVGF